MALLSAFHITAQEIEKRLGRPLRGDHYDYQTERTVVQSLNDNEIEEVKEILRSSNKLGADFIELVSAHVWAAEAAGRKYKRTDVELRQEVWAYYARERRLTGRTLKSLVTEGVERDYRRQAEASDRLEVLTQEVSKLRLAAERTLTATEKGILSRLEALPDLGRQLEAIHAGLKDVRELAEWVRQLKRTLEDEQRKRTEKKGWGLLG